MGNQSRRVTLPQKSVSNPLRLWLAAAALTSIALIALVYFFKATESPKQIEGALNSPAAAVSPLTTPSNPPKNSKSSIMTPAVVLNTAYPTLDGRMQRLADYSGKILVIDIWATWCGPCRVEIPHLIELSREFKDRGVEVIGLTTEDPAKDQEKVREFARQFKINYPLGFANGEFAKWLMQGRDVVPQTYVIGRGGILHRHFVGFNAQTSPPQLRAAVEEALNREP